MNIAKDLINKAIILGVKIDDRPLEWFVDETIKLLKGNETKAVFTPNPEICLKAAQLKHYREILNSANFNLPDGIGLKFGAKILGTSLKNHVTGVDFTASLLKIDQVKNVFIILRDDSLARPEDVKKYFEKNIPALKYQIEIISKSDKPDKHLVSNIINSQAQILFVCLGAPEQETYIYELLNKNLGDNLKLALGVGGSFDFLCNKMPRAPKLMRRVGLEWLFRFYKEPKRLKRIKNATADFLLKCYEWSRRIKNTYRENVMGIIKNKAGLYLIQKNPRLENHWQFPQGGIDQNEIPEKAVLREICEELNINYNELEVVKKLTAENIYKSPPQYQLLHGYKGQKQIAFLINYNGDISEANFAPTDEASEIKWLKKEDLLKQVHPVRQEFVKRLLSEI